VHYGTVCTLCCSVCEGTSRQRGSTTSTAPRHARNKSSKPGKHCGSQPCPPQSTPTLYGVYLDTVLSFHIFQHLDRGSRSFNTMAETSDNPLLSNKPSDSGISVSLHPLVLLTASDQITRHRVRGDAGPIVGILLGQQDGRQITAEHAFAAGTATDEATGKLIFKQPWLNDRVQQCNCHAIKQTKLLTDLLQTEMSIKHPPWT
jgi:hypothetical protein